jgi:hypothetical protein
MRDQKKFLIEKPTLKEEREKRKEKKRERKKRLPSIYIARVYFFFAL